MHVDQYGGAAGVDGKGAAGAFGAMISWASTAYSSVDLMCAGSCFGPA